MPILLKWQEQTHDLQWRLKRRFRSSKGKLRSIFNVCGLCLHVHIHHGHLVQESSNVARSAARQRRDEIGAAAKYAVRTKGDEDQKW